MDAETATERICRALSNPYTTILGHATARLLLRRRGYVLDWPHVIETAARYGVVIELNANPRRLDVDWTLLPQMFEAGVRTSINPDAHSTAGIDDMEYGVCIARKAGTTPDRVLNCLELSEIVQYFDARRTN
jgi:DNA polymerase (family 10)